jgi:hypothetical protein
MQREIRNPKEARKLNACLSPDYAIGHVPRKPQRREGRRDKKQIQVPIPVAKQ